MVDPVASILDMATGPELNVGATLGAWQLKSLLGQGGMGSVYLAERSDGHFAQLAAIKLFQGIPTKEALALLAKERQILALLTHPNIAHLIDGGATPRGQPYLVIEYVRGVPIDAYCKSPKLNRDAILRLVQIVCEAVAFAHQQLIVHCDIKPSNVLVDSNGRPVLLDFGIARLLGQVDLGHDGATESLLTLPQLGEQDEVQASAFTPRYASPEQREGGVIATTTDVFGVGALLRELLLGKPFLSHHEMAKFGIEINAIIDKATAANPANRYASVQLISVDIKRYLAGLPLSALPPTPLYIAKKLIQRRWGVMLAGMIFLMTSTTFTWRLFAERNLANQSAAIALAERDIAARARDSASLAERAATSAESVAVNEKNRAEAAEAKALNERDRARLAELEALRQRNLAITSEKKSVAAELTAKQEVATTEAVSQFMARLFEGADPRLNKGEEATARKLVEQGRDRIATLAAQPATQARLKGALATVFTNLGQPQDATPLLEEALKFERAITPLNTERMLDLLVQISSLKYAGNQLKAAEQYGREALELALQTHAPDSTTLAIVKQTLASTLIVQRNTKEALPLVEDALRIQALNSPMLDSVEYANALNVLALYYQWVGDFTKSETALNNVISIYRIKLGATHPATVAAMLTLARSLAALRRLDDAEALYATITSTYQKIYPSVSLQMADIQTEIGNLLVNRGRFQEAAVLFTKCVEIHAAISGKKTDIYGIALESLGTARQLSGDIVNAEKLLRQALAVRGGATNVDDINVHRLRHQVGVFLLNIARTSSKKSDVARRKELQDESLQLILAAYAARKKVQMADEPEMLASAIALADWDLFNGEVMAARARIDAISQLPIKSRRLPSITQALQRVTALTQLSLGEDEKALTTMRDYANAVSQFRGAEHPATAGANIDLAEVLLKTNQLLQAKQIATNLKNGILRNNDIFVADAPHRARIEKILATSPQ
jgi:eukaryotic-like serine/threonine-protein kinase